MLPRRGRAFVCAREHAGDGRIGPEIRRAFGGSFIANEKYTLDLSEQELAAGNADAIAFGVKFIANPDLPLRLRLRAPLNEVERATLYGNDAAGYTDYPALPAAA